MSDLTFNSEKHEYFWKNKKVLGVNQVLDAAGFKNYEIVCSECESQIHSFVNEEIMERAANFGKALHHACHLLSLGILDWDTVDKELLPYLEGWQQFCVDYEAWHVASEKMVYSEAFEFAGTVDNISELSIGRTIIDIKTGRKNKKHRLQLAGYALAENPDAKRAAVYLGPDYEDNYSFELFDNPEDLDAFTAALEIAKWKSKRQKWDNSRKKQTASS